MNTCMKIKCFESKIKMYRRNINWRLLWLPMKLWMLKLVTFAIYVPLTGNNRKYCATSPVNEFQENKYLLTCHVYINWGNEVKVSGLFENPKVNETNDCLLNQLLRKSSAKCRNICNKRKYESCGKTLEGNWSPNRMNGKRMWGKRIWK